MGRTRGNASNRSGNRKNDNSYAVRQPIPPHGPSKGRGGHYVTNPDVADPVPDPTTREMRGFYNADLKLRGYSGPGYANNKWAKGHSSDLFLGEVYVPSQEAADTGYPVYRRGDIMGPNHDEKTFYKPGPYSTVVAMNDENGLPILPYASHKPKVVDRSEGPLWYNDAHDLSYA